MTRLLTRWLALALTLSTIIIIGIRWTASLPMPDGYAPWFALLALFHAVAWGKVIATVPDIDPMPVIPDTLKEEFDELERIVAERESAKNDQSPRPDQDIVKIDGTSLLRCPGGELQRGREKCEARPAEEQIEGEDDTAFQSRISGRSRYHGRL